MIQPNMATMLAFVTTDAPLTLAACDAALARRDVARAFNRITVDADTSTNDMCLLMASGAAGGAGDRAGAARVTTRVARAVASRVRRARAHDRARRRGRDEVHHGHRARGADTRPTPRPPRSRSRTRRSFKTRDLRRATRTGAGSRWPSGKSAAQVDPTARGRRSPASSRAKAGRRRRSTRTPRPRRSPSDDVEVVGRPAPRRRRGDRVDVRPHLRLRAHQRRLPQLGGLRCRTCCARPRR